MGDSASYFAAIRAEQARIDKAFPDGYCYVISVKNHAQNSTPGTVSQVTNKQAAAHLCNSTARIAEESEISAHLARGAAFSKLMATQSFNRKKADTSAITITLSK